MASRKRTPGAARKKARNDHRPAFMRVARPDAIDPRDRRFTPNVSVTPAPTLFPARGLPVKHQGDTNACTGFALSLVVEHLLRKSGRERQPAISPFMLYSMARRYDEFPGSVEDQGSSLRGALKGWFKHGACREILFAALQMPPASKVPEDDWWFDAVRRPLGAYYRIEIKRITDMHAALNEVGVLYASAGCHAGWDDGMALTPRRRRPPSIDKVWVIPVRGGQAAHPGHAFAIVGYDHRGFLIQNSWGPTWGAHGYAILSYDDWLHNAMDCWVAQLGVVTQDHRELAHSPTLRTDAAGHVALAASEVLRNREISPFIVNMGNNGLLSNSGVFRTRPDDVRAIVEVQLPQARQAWRLARKPLEVCIYAHGGLVGEAVAADIAAQWIHLLYEQHVFPVFLMWETDFISTVMFTIEDAMRGVPRTTGGGYAIERWWNQRLERLLARPGTQIWNELKQNADAISCWRPDVPDDEQAGGVLLYRHFRDAVQSGAVHLHLVGHSAGAVVACSMIDRLARDGIHFESVSFMAPAVTVKRFDQQVRPHLDSGVVGRFQQFSLTDRAEEDDPTCGPYLRSLLYLLSESFEGGATTPILGMQKYAQPYFAALPRSTLLLAPGPVSASSTHGGFDNDPGTRAAILRFIREEP